MMSEETWMDAQTSVDFGFASEVFNGMRAAAKLHPDRFKYKNVPSALLQQPPRSSDNLPRRDVRFAEMTALVNEVPEDIKKRHASANGKRRSSRAAKLRAKAC